MMDMKLLVVGGGGREHAITRALSCTVIVSIFSVMAQKNPRIARLAERVLLEKETDIPEDTAVCHHLRGRCRDHRRKLAASEGSSITSSPAGIPCVGPTRAAAGSRPTRRSAAG